MDNEKGYTPEAETSKQEFFNLNLYEGLNKFFTNTTLSEAVTHLNATFETATNAFQDDGQRLWNADTMATNFSQHAALLNFLTEAASWHKALKESKKRGGLNKSE